VQWVGVFRDVEILLNGSPGVGKERPVRSDPTAVFVGFSDVVGADSYQPAVTYFELAMKLDQAFRLASIFGAEAAAAEDKNHWIRALQFGELPPLRGVIGELIVGKDCAWNDIRSHV
jgi:hypothetical protein